MSKAVITTTTPPRGTWETLLPEPCPTLFEYKIGGREAYGSLCTPLGNPNFRRQLKALRDRVAKADAFLDVGCGYGNILWLVKRLNPRTQVSGLEINPKIAIKAARFGQVFCEDAFKFPNYADFDLLYTYRPLVNYQDQLALEALIIGQMRPGATLISLLPVHHLLCRPAQRGCYTKSFEVN